MGQVAFLQVVEWKVIVLTSVAATFSCNIRPVTLKHHFHMKSEAS